MHSVGPLRDRSGSRRFSGVRPHRRRPVVAAIARHIAESLQTHINWADRKLARMRLRHPAARSATLGFMSFSTEDLEQLAATEEVEIETQAPDKPARRTVIWVVVDEGEAFIRTYRGAGSRWYRDIEANPAVAIHVGGRRIPATAIPATDPDSIERTSAAILKKYAGDPAAKAMNRPELLETTLRLEPA